MERTSEGQEDARGRRNTTYKPDGGEGSRPELDAVLRWADQRCVYERLLVWAWLLPVCLLTPCAYMTIILMVYAPPHTCAAPASPDALTSQAWRNLTLPRDGTGKFKTCQMYDYEAAIGDSLGRLSAQRAPPVTSGGSDQAVRNPLARRTYQEDGKEDGKEKEEVKQMEGNEQEAEREKKKEREEQEWEKKERENAQEVEGKKEKVEHHLKEEPRAKGENAQEAEGDEEEEKHQEEMATMQETLDHSIPQHSLHGTTNSRDGERAEENYRKAALEWLERYPSTLPENVTDCLFGYAFDAHYFTATATTEFEWVCAEEYSATRVLQASMFGNLVGCLIFGPLADRIGRRRTFLLLALKVAVLGSVFVLLRDTWLMLLVRFQVSLGLPIIYQIVIISASEQVRDERRGPVTALSSVFFSLGQCLMALVAWLTGDWVKLGLITSLPAFLALVYVKVIEESPRWLVSRGRMDEAAKVLLRIARMNRVDASEEEVLARLRKPPSIRAPQASAGPREQRDGSRAPSSPLALVPRYPRLAVRVLLVVLCWTVNLMMYFSTMLSYSNVFEDPFLGWFFTSVVEIPANLLVLFLLGRVGRRPLHVAVMTLCAASLLAAAALLAMGYEATHIGVAALVLLAKFCSSMTFLVMYLQAAELSPTPVRSCVTGFASLVASSFNLVTPVIMMLPGHSYLILGSLATCGVIFAIFLPETAKRPLPQTLEDADCLTSLPSGRPQVPPPSAVPEDDPRRSLAETTI
ncbi:organic cation transporter protein isoform X1 [Penaeus vannamei]|uniref:organic cation transporter protein isoform X1 n=1 Tax=Penaeus vannamei TaxID=6689 RepID=UPI00387F5185